MSVIASLNRMSHKFSNALEKTEWCVQCVSQNSSASLTISVFHLSTWIGRYRPKVCEWLSWSAAKILLQPVNGCGLMVIILFLPQSCYFGKVYRCFDL